MNDITGNLINQALNKSREAGVLIGTNTAPEGSLEELYHAELALFEHVQFLTDRMESAEKELTYRDSGIWNRFRTWVGIRFAEHYAFQTDLNEMLSDPTGWLGRNSPPVNGSVQEL